MADTITIEECITRLDAIRHEIVSNSRDHFALSAGIAALYEMENGAHTVNRWIPVEDALPEKDGEYLVFTEYEDVFKCTFDSNEENKWGFEQDYRDPDTLGWAGTTWTAVETVTHWMPLPEPPKEDET